MALQKALVGARYTIFREDADDFEQGRTHFVIQIFRRQLLLSRAEQARADVPGKIRLRILSYDCSGHDVSSRGIGVSAFDAAESRINVRIVGLEPIAKRPPQHASG